MGLVKQGSGAGMGDTLPARTVSMGVLGCAGGQTTQSGFTRTPGPAVAVVAVVGSTCYGLTLRIYLGGGAGNAYHAYWARPTNCAESPKARGTALGWRAPGCGLGVKIPLGYGGTRSRDVLLRHVFLDGW